MQQVRGVIMKMKPITYGWEIKSGKAWIDFDQFSSRDRYCSHIRLSHDGHICGYFRAPTHVSKYGWYESLDGGHSVFGRLPDEVMSRIENWMTAHVDNDMKDMPV